MKYKGRNLSLLHTLWFKSSFKGCFTNVSSVCFFVFKTVVERYIL